MRKALGGGGRGVLAACLLAPAAASGAEAGDARYFVDIGPCMALPQAQERAGCYEALAALVRRARGLEAAEPPAPPVPPAPARPPAPPNVEDRGLRILRIEEGSPEPGWRLGDEVGVWVDPRGGANILLILDRQADRP